MHQVAIVTGAASGIGRACALRFARAGCAVLLADLDASGINATAGRIIADNGDALAITVDVANSDDCRAMADAAIQKWGRIDSLVANAGVQIGGSLLDSTEQDWETILGVNVRGVAYSCQAVLPSMVEQGSGAVVVNSSINAIRGSAGMAIYDMSKAAVLALVRNLAVEHGASGIRVNAVCPGNTLTDFHIDRMARQGVDIDQLREMTRGYGLLGRAAEPEEIANAIYFLGSDQASFITGQTLCVDGGFSVTGGG